MASVAFDLVVMHPNDIHKLNIHSLQIGIGNVWLPGTQQIASETNRTGGSSSEANCPIPDR